MQVIGAGLPRTATLTQKFSLEMLGFGPCHHMASVLSDLSVLPRWTAAFEGEANWDEIFGDSQSTVDWPGSFFWRELIVYYPDAKVLLSVRSGESWATSIKNTIWDAFCGDVLMRHLSDARGAVDPPWRAFTDLMRTMFRRSDLIGDMSAPFDAAALAAAMERHNQEVRDTVPAERLLEWQPANGWGPLCEFLEVPVPAIPLPNVNDSATFAHRLIEGSLTVLNAWQAKQQPMTAAP